MKVRNAKVFVGHSCLQMHALHGRQTDFKFITATVAQVRSRMLCVGVMARGELGWDVCNSSALLQPHVLPDARG